jgi:hypothetical protein
MNGGKKNLQTNLVEIGSKEKLAYGRQKEEARRGK